MFKTISQLTQPRTVIAHNPKTSDWLSEKSSINVPTDHVTKNIYEMTAITIAVICDDCHFLVLSTKNAPKIWVTKPDRELLNYITACVSMSSTRRSRTQQNSNTHCDMWTLLCTHVQSPNAALQAFMKCFMQYDTNNIQK